MNANPPRAHARTAAKRTGRLRVIRGDRAPGRRHPRRTYARYALLSPFHLLTITSFAFIAAVSASVLFAGACVVAELALLVLSWKVPAFRRMVDAKLEQVACRKIAEERASLLSRMNERHRAELLRLEALVEDLRATMRLRGAGPHLAIDHCVSLLAMYVRLAIVHHASQTSLGASEPHAILRETKTLDLVKAAGPPQARAVAARRIIVAEARARHLQHARRDLEAIGHQLALIREVIELTREQWAAPADPAASLREIDGVAAELLADRGSIAKLFDLDVTVRPEALALEGEES